MLYEKEGQGPVLIKKSPPLRYREQTDSLQRQGDRRLGGKGEGLRGKIKLLDTDNSMVNIRGRRAEEKGKAGINGDKRDLTSGGGHTIQSLQMLYSRAVYLKPV